MNLHTVHCHLDSRDCQTDFVNLYKLHCASLSEICKTLLSTTVEDAYKPLLKEDSPYVSFSSSKTKMCWPITPLSSENLGTGVKVSRTSFGSYHAEQYYVCFHPAWTHMSQSVVPSVIGKSHFSDLKIRFHQFDLFIAPYTTQVIRMVRFGGRWQFPIVRLVTALDLLGPYVDLRHSRF